MKYTGHSGEIEVQGDALVLTREGRMARTSYGKDVPRRRIPLAAVSGVRFKPATRLINGHMQLLLGGADVGEPKSASQHPDVVIFTYGQRAQFEELHQLLLEAIRRNKEAGIDPSVIEFDEGQVGRLEVKRQHAEAKAEERSAAAQLRTEERKARAEERRAPAGETTAGEPRSAIPVGATVTEQGAGRWVASGYAGANDRLVFSGMSHESGRNARVTLYPNRLEREKPKKRSALISANQDVEVTPVRNISSVETKRDGMAFTKVTVYAVGNNIEFRFTHNDAAAFKQRLTELLLQEPIAVPPAPAPVLAAPVDIADQLKKLAALRDDGILTEEEFSQQKRRLLE